MIKPLPPSNPTTKRRGHHSRVLLLGLVLSGCCTCKATWAIVMNGSLPTYSISPTTNGLTINYFAKQDNAKISLYLVNQESFRVTCQARYESGPERKSSGEQILAPTKAVAFYFDYGRHSKDIKLAFVCIKTAP